MAQVRTLKWNDLPRTTRDRLLQAFVRKPPPKGEPLADNDQPILVTTASTTGSVIGWGVLALLIGGVLYLMYTATLGRLYYAGRSFQSTSFIFYYGVAWFLLVSCVLAGFYRHLLGKNLPYREGTYLFGLDVIETKVDQVTITPLALLSKIRVTDHYRNGAYQYTAYVMDFPGRPGVYFSVRKDQPDQIQAQLQSARKRLGAAVENKDLDALKKADLLFDIRAPDWQPRPELNLLGDGPLTKPIEPWLDRRRLVAAAAGLVLGLVTWQVRDLHHDHERFTQAVRNKNSESLVQYLDGGKRYRREAAALLYPMLYAEAKQKGTVSAYRDMLQKYPQTPLAKQARQDIHALIQASWEKFKERAGSGDPKMLAFMQRVIDYQEQKDNSAIALYFSPPLIRSLVAIDADLRKKGVAPVAAHFSPAASKPREYYIASALEKGFGAVFPSDVLQFTRPAAPMPAAPAVPTIEIKYMVTPTDSIYQGKQSGRSFVGIRVNFLLTLSVPGETTSFPIMLSVFPPQRFTVSFSSRRRYGTDPLPGEGPSDLAVYTAMAERAFDQFHDKLAQVFFGAAPVVDPSDAPPPAPGVTAGTAAPEAAADAPEAAPKPTKRKRRH